MLFYIKSLEKHLCKICENVCKLRGSSVTIDKTNIYTYYKTYKVILKKFVMCEGKTDATALRPHKDHCESF